MEECQIELKLFLKKKVKEAFVNLGPLKLQ